MSTIHRAGVLVAVAVGGALGTVARYELALAEPVQSGRFPWATFLANVAGSLVLGVVLAAFVSASVSHQMARALLGIGVSGGLTTFSTWMVESVLLTRDGEVDVAAGYLVVSLLAGLLAVVIGMSATRRVLGRDLVPVFDPRTDD